MTLRRLGRVNSLDGLLAHDSLYPAEATCMHPDCSNLCHHRPDGRGRARLFCSKPCATDYSQCRQALLAELAAIDAVVADLPRSSNDAVALRRQRSRVLWILARYGGEPATTP